MNSLQDQSDIFDIGLDADDDEEDLIISPSALIQMLEEAWLNEKFAPEILPNKMEIVELLLGQLKAMEENLSTIGNRDIMKSIYQLEIDRLKFLVSSYLRLRLEKIETYVNHILNQEKQRLEKDEETYLSISELKFAKSFWDSICNNFDSFMKINNPGLEADAKKQVIQPNIYSFVFSKSKADIESIIIDEATEDETVYVHKDSQMIISYKSVANFVKGGEMQLI